MKNKKLIGIIALILAINACVIFACLSAEKKATESLYTKVAQVVEADEETDLVLLEDFHGNLWQYKGIEGWEETNALCVIIFDNNKTEEITDDIIIRVDPQGVTDPDGWVER